MSIGEFLPQAMKLPEHTEICEALSAKERQDALKGLLKHPIVQAHHAVHLGSKTLIVGRDQCSASLAADQL